MSQKGVKTPFLSSSSKKNLPTSSDSTKLPKKSLKRPLRDSSSPEINENDDENSCEIIFDKSDTIKPSKAKKAKKVAVVNSDSEVFEDDDVPKKNKSVDSNKKESKKAKKPAAAIDDDDEDFLTLDEDVSSLPSESKKKNKKQTPSKRNSIDETDVGPSSQPKKPNTDKKNGEGSTAALGDKTLSQNPKKKKSETPKNVNTLEKAFAKSNPERFFKPKETKNDDDAESESVSDASEILPPKKKKSTGNETSKKHKNSDDSSSEMEDIEPLPPKFNKVKSTDKADKKKKSNSKKAKKSVSVKDSDESSSDTEIMPPKPKKSAETKDKIEKSKKKKSTEGETNREKPEPKKAKKVLDIKESGDSSSSIENVRRKPKKKTKTPANSNENTMDIVFDKSDGGASSSKTKKAKASTDKTSSFLKPATDKSSPKESKKKVAAPSSAKKSTQQSIFGFCTVQSPAVAPNIDEKVKAKELYDDALKALGKSQHTAFKQIIRSAQKLSDSAIETIESECFKFAVYKHRKNSEDFDENENKFNRMLWKFTNNICEDTSITNSKPFPDLKYAMESSQYYNLFGSCLAISQFFVSFPTFLDSSLKFSAKDLLTAVMTGAEGYHKLTGEILADFLHAFSIYEWFNKDYKFFSTNLRDVKWSATSASEICKVFLLKDISPLIRPLTKTQDEKLYDLLKNNKADLEKKFADLNLKLPPFDENLAAEFMVKDFHELSPKQQIQIFEYLIELFMVDYFFVRQYDPEECKIFPKEKIDAMKKEHQDMVIAHANMKREEKRRGKEEKRPDHLYFRKKKKLESDILHAERRTTLNKLHSALKPLPITLGYDRFHRRYYLFPNSLNRGIYIEEFCSISINEETQFENDPIAAGLEKLTIETARKPLKTSLWYHVSTKEEFEEIKAILSKKGIRENALFEAISQNEALISSTFNALPQLRSLKFNENETELLILKAAINKVLNKAEKHSLIHFSQKYDELIDKVLAAESFEELRGAIVSSTSAILPCAFPLFAAGVKFFRITSWIRFAELSKSYSQMHALLLILHNKIRTDNLFGSTLCPRCDVRIDRSKNKVISCCMCYVFIHFKCHDTFTETEPSPSEPQWICEKCKKPEVIEEEEQIANEEDDEVLEIKPKSIIIGHKYLRATKARVIKEDTVSIESSSRGSSRNSVWENTTTRSLRPRNNTKNYAEKSDSFYVPEKNKLKTKNLAPPPPPREKKVVEEEIQEHYDNFCSDYRIFSSLRQVKFDACDNSECTLDLLKKYLYKFKKVEQLDEAFRNLLVAANFHFKHNTRKLDEIQRHFADFFGEEFVTDNDEETEEEEKEGGSEAEEDGDEDDSDIKVIDEEEEEGNDSDIEIIGSDNDKEEENGNGKVVEEEDDE
uniref:PHD-type domain-containing protein n=1 Tax=Panagrolaimus sp. PS1159 TaxID=55785 RepID=A0AC35F9H3_9BILA